MDPQKADKTSVEAEDHPNVRTFKDFPKDLDLLTGATFSKRPLEDSNLGDDKAISDTVDALPETTEKEDGHWSPQGEVALRCFLKQLTDLDIPVFVPERFQRPDFDPMTFDLESLLLKPEDWGEAHMFIKAFREGPCESDEDMPELSDGQYAMHLTSRTSRGTPLHRGYTTLIVFEFMGKDIKVVDAEIEIYRMS